MDPKGKACKKMAVNSLNQRQVGGSRATSTASSSDAKARHHDSDRLPYWVYLIRFIVLLPTMLAAEHESDIADKQIVLILVGLVASGKVSHSCDSHIFLPPEEAIHYTRPPLPKPWNHFSQSFVDAIKTTWAIDEM
jgi:hypothetical protein